MREKRRGATPTLLRELNGQAIVDTLRKKGPLSRAMLAKTLGLSRPTVSNLVDRLIADRWIEEIGEGHSPVGRKPILLKFNQRAGFVLGVDLGGTKVLCGVADLEGNLLSRVKQPSRAAEGTEVALPALKEAMRKALSEAGVPPGALLAIGLCCPGVLNPETGTFALAPNLSGFDRLPLGSLLEQEFGVPVRVANDVNAAAVGESWRGAARHRRHVVFVSVGTGLGAGVLINGEVFEGAAGAAGEIGYMAFDRRGRETREHGFLETVASGYGLARAAAAVAWPPQPPRGFAEWPPQPPVTPERLMELAKLGQPDALGIVDQLTEYLALGLNNIVSILNPEVIVLGGSVICRNPWLKEAIAEKFRQLTPVETPIELSQLGENAALHGATKQAIDQVFASLGRATS
ncbi:MAG: ROK family transcriptional regulator [Bacillota bacterium]|nr:ROK family transcriptional regulator [Bacillota bacterium]